MRHTHHIGVDVSDSSIKVLELTEEGRVAAFGSAPLSAGVVQNGTILNTQAFADTLTQVLHATKPAPLSEKSIILRAILCLPETKLFTHMLSIPESVSRSGEEDFVKKDSEKIIPFGIDELYWNYEVAEENGVRTAVFVGVPKADLDTYVQAFSLAQVQPSFVGSELFSLGRALLPKQQGDERYLIVDIGAHSTVIGMFGKDAIAQVSIVIPKGGDFFTAVIADELGMDAAKAEEEKRMYGVDITNKRSRAPHILKEHVETVIEKILETKNYFEGKSGKQVRTLILSGGSALMPGLRELVAEKTGLETALADPFKRIADHEVFGTETPGILYSTVIGLALHAHSKDPGINLLSLYRFDQSNTDKELMDIREIRTWGDLYYVVFTYMQKGKYFFQQRFTHVKVPDAHALKVGASLIFMVLTLTFLAWVIIQYM